MKVLVIGSKGFIGSNLMQHLKSKHEVWGCDVYPDYNEINYFAIDASAPRYHFVFQHHHFDFCVNCAGAASVPDSLKSPARDFELNTHLVFRLLETIREFDGSCAFLNISSAAVYGNPNTLPITESHPVEPISPYGFHKMQADLLCKEFFDFFGIKTCSLRVFSAFGAGLKKQIFWDLYRKSQQSNAIELPGTGLETRDYIYVTDLAGAIEVVLQKSDFKGSIFNVASGIARPIKEVVKTFFSSMGWKGEVRFSNKRRAGDPEHWHADIRKIKNLGFTPTISIEEGINLYAEWLKGLPSD